MKSLNDIIKQTPIYLNDWKDKIDLIKDFDNIYNLTETIKEEKLKEWQNINILFASYGQANYSGDAFVLFENNSKLFEVHAIHCSCYGLEGQWELEETTLESLSHRLIVGKMGESNYSDNVYSTELKQFLGIN